MAFFRTAASAGPPAVPISRAPNLPATPPPDHAHAPGPVDAPCASCGARLHGPYCHACGEKRLGPHDYALGHWLEHAVDAFTHFDLKVPRSLWSLLRRPGAMTADVLAGRRRSWASPFQVFLIANLVYYALATWLHLGTFETPLRYHFDYRYGDLARRLSEAQAAHLGLTLDAYAERFDHLAHTLAKTLVIFFVPVFAGLFALLHRRPRRYALEHVIAGMHFTSLLLLLLLVPIPIIIAIIMVFHLPSTDVLWTICSVFLLGGYARAFFRHVYGDTRGVAAAKAVAVPFVFYAALIYLYRPLLFLIVHRLL